MRKLYDFELSGNCQKIRMLLSFLDLDYERIDIDLRKRDQMNPNFIALNSLHKIPVLDDDGLILRDSAAIMIYLVRKYGKPDWYPEIPEAMAEIQQWLSFSVNEVFNGLAMARAIIIFKRDADPETARTIATTALQEMEGRLRNHEWLALDRFTIADLACYPYTALLHEGELSLDEYPRIRGWCQRIEALDHYIGMRGLPYPHT